MKWKVIVQGDTPSEDSVRVLIESTGLVLDEILMAFSHEDEVVCNGLSEGEAQKIADSLRRDSGIRCIILPDHEIEVQSAPLFRVLLVNYRPGYRTRVRRRLQKLTHLPQEQIVNWLSRMPIALSRGINSETAKTIKKSLTEAGGIIRIEAESLPQDSVTPSRRSNAVFRTPGTRAEIADPDDHLSDSLFADHTGTADDDVSRIPPVSDLPEQYSIGPPPVDEYDTSYGRVLLQPPERFAVGLPSKSLDGGFLETPAILPDVSNRSIPETFEFSPPEMASGDCPPVVGCPEHDPLKYGPAPDRVMLFPPPGSIFQHLLHPPVLGESMEYPFSTGDESPYDVEIHDDLESESRAIMDVLTSASKVDSRRSKIPEGEVIRLFLCTPAPENEDSVAKALCDVMGISLRESWNLLRKTPTLLEACDNHKRAIKKAHELNSRGVTVSLTRGDISDEIPSASTGEGFQAWLKKNG